MDIYGRDAKTTTLPLVGHDRVFGNRVRNVHSEGSITRNLRPAFVLLCCRQTKLP
jgi:hypothetical protein